MNIDERNKNIEVLKPEIDKLARALSKEYNVYHNLYEDLQKTGYVALMKSYKRYDETKGVSLYTFAYSSIRYAMLDEIRRYFNSTSIPKHLNEQLIKIKRLAPRF